MMMEFGDGTALGTVLGVFTDIWPVAGEYNATSLFAKWAKAGFTASWMVVGVSLVMSTRISFQRMRLMFLAGGILWVLMVLCLDAWLASNGSARISSAALVTGFSLVAGIYAGIFFLDYALRATAYFTRRIIDKDSNPTSVTSKEVQS